MKRLTSAELAAGGRNIETPFITSILTDGIMPVGSEHSQSGKALDLRIDKILRLLPGKRLVAVSSWQGMEVIVKIFFQPGHWERHFSREQAGNLLIREAGIATPATLLGAVADDGKGGVLLNEYLKGAHAIGDLLTGSNDQDLSLTKRVLSLVNQCHVFGLLQHDIHLDNFLLYNDEVYLLDSADVRIEKKGEPLSATARLNNLAVFFAQFPVAHDSNLDQLVNHLNQSGNATLPKLRLDEVQQQVSVARRKRVAAYVRKLTRNSSAHLAQRTNSRHMVCSRNLVSDEFLEFVSDPDYFLERGEMLKAGNSSTVVIVTIDNRRYLLKRYNIKGLTHGLKRMFGRSRALNSWCFAHILTMLGIDTAAPLMMLERRWLRWLRREAYFLCELVEGKTVADLMAEPGLSGQTRTNIFQAFSELFSVMEKSQLCHGDFKASNFIYNDNKLFVLDLDAMVHKENTRVFRKCFRKDLDRFARNWIGNIESSAIAAQALQVTGRFSDSHNS